MWDLSICWTPIFSDLERGGDGDEQPIPLLPIPPLARYKNNVGDVSEIIYHACVDYCIRI